MTQGTADFALNGIVRSYSGRVRGQAAGDSVQVGAGCQEDDGEDSAGKGLADVTDQITVTCKISNSNHGSWRR